ncbi:hypothetical protein CER18_08025 [Bartonella tribocorum]|uniref:Uncharacterized protein n=1 Tax=Bartonella tribocorum TaxID=85701 RepID=A0A2N9Y8W8_9HYPH|nr:hypothetical protein CER18_08025 [Bartonella tribocorum]
MLMRIKKEITKSPKTDLWIICALSPDQQREWTGKWCLKNKQIPINCDDVNDLSASGSFYRSRQNDYYGSSPSNHFPQKMTISFMRLMLLLITTLKAHYSLSLLIRCEVLYRPKCLLNFGVVIKNNFSWIFEWGYETATFSQKNVLFSENSHCTVYGTTQ